MTGQDIQDRFDAIVSDLQDNVGTQYQVMLRDEDNNPSVLQVSSDGMGVVNAGEVAGLQAFIDNLKPIADAYEAARAPITAAGDAYRAARAVHQNLIDAYSAARTALNNALEGDAAYQNAKDGYDLAREDAAYIAARNAYKLYNVSENYGNLQDAKNKPVT
jgi:hypothetical protein